MEQIDQEITLQLQRIDSNLSHCFAKITREIIPCVEKYGSTCDELVDSVSYLAALFRGTGDVTLQGQENVINETQPIEDQQQEIIDNTGDINHGDTENTLETNSTNDSTRQRKKRKVSLLLQRKYGSSSPRERDETYTGEEGTLGSVAVLKFNTGSINNNTTYNGNNEAQE